MNKRNTDFLDHYALIISVIKVNFFGSFCVFKANFTNSEYICLYSFTSPALFVPLKLFPRMKSKEHSDG